MSPCNLPGGKGTAVFVPQSLSNTQANRVPVVLCGFSCSSLRWLTSTLPTLQGALQLCVGPQLWGSGLPCLAAPSSPGRRILAPLRFAGSPVGVAARRRAPTAVNNGAGREEKGNLLEEAARARGRADERAREERVHFCPGVSKTRPPRARAKEHRRSRSASSGKPGEGSRRRDRRAPAGRGAGEPGQRGEPRGARPGRAPGAAQDAARRVAVAATAPLWL